MTTPRVLVVAQAFKESLSLGAVAHAVATGVRDAGAEPDILLGSDGGDGLLDALAPRLSHRETLIAMGPLGSPVDVDVGWLGSKTAVLETRLVCGLSLVPPAERDPRRTTTRGVGELVHLLGARGARDIVVGLGGSATMDGGLGMARAWGWVPRDAGGNELPEGGGALVELAHLDPAPKPTACLLALTDVRNPLAGPNGARVYAPQKGADPPTVELLARGLERLVAATVRWGGQGLSLQEGAGAAGGLGFGIACFGGGVLARGAPWVLDQAGFAARLAQAALVVTGEGAFDRTSGEGKLVGEVLRRAAVARVPAALLAPHCSGAPEGVIVESGGGWWDDVVLAQRARIAVTRALTR